jgi:homocysteine S-methyltransferase
LRDPLWSARLLLENPALIQQVHYDYFCAGAEVATTASYQATLPGLMRRGLDRAHAIDVLRRSVLLALQARAEFWHSAEQRQGRREPLVAASIGCYGAFLHDGSEYRGDYGLSVAQLIDWHRPRLEILASCGADLLACETVPCLTEAIALVRLLAEYPTVPAWLSVSCKDDEHLCHGEPFTEVVALTNAAPNIVAVGVNCTAPRFVEGLLLRGAGIATKPLLAYPNAGETWDAARSCWRPTPTEPDWHASVLRWHQAGARLLGGCCRTTPETIRHLAASLRAAHAL